MATSDTGLNQLRTTFKTLEEMRKVAAEEKMAREIAYKEAVAKIPKPADFYLAHGLYDVLEFAGVQAFPILEILYPEGTYDCFCVGCQKQSTFTFERRRRPVVDSPKPPVDSGIHSVRSVCARNQEHEHMYIMLVTEDERASNLQKIGQFPSYADIHVEQLKDYSSVLSNQHRKELSKAIGLAAHGVGVGSYVYLRRVFESLVEDARLTAVKDHGFDDTDYSTKKMGQKISALKDFLPELMTKNTKLYGVLSKGVHELTEEECLKYFDPIRYCIELILTEKMDQKNKLEKQQAAEKAISKI